MKSSQFNRSQAKFSFHISVSKREEQFYSILLSTGNRHNNYSMNDGEMSSSTLNRTSAPHVLSPSSSSQSVYIYRKWQDSIHLQISYMDTIGLRRSLALISPYWSNFDSIDIYFSYCIRSSMSILIDMSTYSSVFIFSSTRRDYLIPLQPFSKLFRFASAFACNEPKKTEGSVSFATEYHLRYTYTCRSPSVNTISLQNSSLCWHTFFHTFYTKSPPSYLLGNTSISHVIINRYTLKAQTDSIDRYDEEFHTFSFKFPHRCAPWLVIVATRRYNLTILTAKL